MKENNKNKIFAVIAIGVLILLLIGSTFAYFAAQGTDASQTDVNVLTHTVDSLVFETGDALSITADQTSFAQGKGNQTDFTFARATLKANSSTNTATDHYYVYLSIDENTFEYTTTEKTAELILTINKVEGETKTAVTTMDGLNYVTVGSVSGFDITEYDDLITIANNYEITSTGTKIDEWEVTLTLVNLDSNQSVNAGKIFNAQLLIQKQPVASQYIASLFTTQGANHLYHHDGTITDSEGNIIDAEDGSYRYAGGDYTIAPAYQETYKRISKKVTTDTDALLGFMCGMEEKQPTAACNEETQYFYLTYETSETKTQYATYKEALNKLAADGYLLETPVKNYVCFGSDADVCPYDNLYRIIGIIDGKAKLIKADYATKELLGSDGDAFVPSETETEYSLNRIYRGNLEGTVDTFYWNKANKDITFIETGYYNVWSYSELNKKNLNNNFLNNIGSEWSDKIRVSTYYISGGAASTAKAAYDKEVGTNKSTLFNPYNAKVGLMYINDYLYSAIPEVWKIEYSLYSSYRDNNWLYIGGCSEWPISRTFSPKGAYLISLSGSVYINKKLQSPYVTSDHYAVRPTFFLKSSVTFDGGTGTASDPYRIA